MAAIRAFDTYIYVIVKYIGAYMAVLGGADAITFTADYRKQIAQSWDVWDIVGTIGVLFLCGCFYWYFF